MKFLVMVNGKYMVNVEANSLCSAEHVILDKFADEINKYQVITGCQAFNRSDLGTKWFMEDYFDHCETVSMKELEDVIIDIKNNMLDAEQSDRRVDEISAQIDELEAEYEAYRIQYAARKTELKNRLYNAGNAAKESRDAAERIKKEILGATR